MHCYNRWNWLQQSLSIFVKQQKLKDLAGLPQPKVKINELECV